MTRRDYEFLAAVIAGARGKFASNTSHAAFAAIMAESLATDNPRFVRARFIRACMPRAWVGTTRETAWERQARKVEP
jgi:hypothetical protein